MRNPLTSLGCMVLASAALLFAGPGHAAEPWSDLNQEITFVVPFGAGGSTNATARIMAQKLQELGVSTKVVNMPGAGGTQGTHWCSQQPPESGVVCVMSPSSFLYNPAIEDTGYNWGDFEPVATWGGASFAFAVQPDSRFDTFTDAIEFARENPGDLIIGSTGTGDQAFIIEEIFEDAEAEFTYVPFAGGGEVTTNLIGGHIDIGYISVAGLAPLVNDSQLRMFAHTSPFEDRLAAFPDVPHIAEYGHNQQAVSFYSIWGPKGMPSETRAAIAAAVLAACEDESLIQENEEFGISVQCRGVEETREYIQQVVDTVVPRFVEWKQRQE